MTNNTNISTPELLLRHGYQYISLIGEGSNGKTYMSKCLKTGEIVAIKALKFSDNLKSYELFKREAETLKSIHTSGTPRFYEYITGEEEFTECWLVQEYIEGNSLLDKMENGEKFNEIDTLKLIFEAAKIVHTLQTSYAPPIIHRDIKPSNILMCNHQNDNTKLYLIDFGAVANPQKRGLNSTVAGTVGYMAPEQLIGDCTIQSDYYALGATALHLMTGVNPSEFPTDGFTIQFEDQLKLSVPTIHKETIELLHTLLAPNANERPHNSHALLNSISQALVSISSIPISQLAETRKSLELKLRIVNSTFFKIICCFSFEVSIFIIFIILSTWIGAPAKNIFLVRFSIIPIIIFIAIIIYGHSIKDLPKKLTYKLNNQLLQLPDYSVHEAEIQKYTVIEETPDLSDNKEAAGEIVRIIDDVIEYVVNIDHEYFTAFYSNDKNHFYQVGDKIRVKYVKKFGKYRFYELRPENLSHDRDT